MRQLMINIRKARAMASNTLATFAAIPFLFASVAMAQTAPPQNVPPEQMPQHNMMQQHSLADRVTWHKKACGEMYAHQVGHLAFLEAKLELTDAQRAAWNKWRQARLDEATKERALCLDNVPKQDAPPNALEREARAEKFMTAKLQAMQAARPALQALYDVLTPEQKTTFDHNSGMDHHGHHHDKMHEGQMHEGMPEGMHMGMHGDN